MKWGDRHEKGCIGTTCNKVHPLLCGKSLDLVYLDKMCPYKLHTLKCKRSETYPSSQKYRTPSTNQKPWLRQGSSRPSPGINPWRSQAGDSDSSQGRFPVHSNQHFQKMTVQPQLEACMFQMRQELWEEVRALRSYLAREVQLAQEGGHRHLF